LKRVIVATGDKVVMEPTLVQTLASLFGTAPGKSGPFHVTATKRDLLGETSDFVQRIMRKDEFSEGH
jgi:uncharacterized membrane protein (UPF0182 family)